MNLSCTRRAGLGPGQGKVADLHHEMLLHTGEVESFMADIFRPSSDSDLADVRSGRCDALPKASEERFFQSHRLVCDFLLYRIVSIRTIRKGLGVTSGLVWFPR